MARRAVFAGVIVLLMACNQENRKISELQIRIDSLENRLNQTYVPGFGEFMSGIQVHHNKLWFAGINRNWPLADFEIHEIIETVGYIQKYQTWRKESRESISCCLYWIAWALQSGLAMKSLSVRILMCSRRPAIPATGRLILVLIL